MTANAYVDACGFVATSTGTVDFVVSAAVVGYQTPAAAGAVNSSIYSYRAESVDRTLWEEGFGAYTVSGTTLARTTVTANSSGGTSKISFSAAPNVYITAASADLQNASLLASGTVPSGRITFAVKSDQTTATSTTVPVNPAVQQFHPSAAKAWVTFTGSTGAILASYNVTSVSRSSAGIYVITFTVPFSSVNYTANAEPVSNSTVLTTQIQSKSTGSVSITAFASGVLTDPTTVDVVCFGTQ